MGFFNQGHHINQGINDTGLPGGIASIECYHRQCSLLNPWYGEDRSSPVFVLDLRGGSQEQLLIVADGAVVLHSKAEENGSGHQTWLIWL